MKEKDCLDAWRQWVAAKLGVKRVGSDLFGPYPTVVVQCHNGYPCNVQTAHGLVEVRFDPYAHMHDAKHIELGGNRIASISKEGVILHFKPETARWEGGAPQAMWGPEQARAALLAPVEKAMLEWKDDALVRSIVSALDDSKGRAIGFEQARLRATENLIKDLGRQLAQAHKDQVRNHARLRELLHTPAKTYREEVEERVRDFILAASVFGPVTFGGGQLNVDLPKMYFGDEEVGLGPFTVEVDVATLEVSVTNTGTLMNSGYQHPHVSGNTICFGDAIENYLAAVERRDLATVVLLACQTLQPESYNPSSAYSEIEEPGEWCDDCDERHVDGCPNYCSDCDNTVNWNEHFTCTDCQSCHDERTDCPKCGNCLVDNECGCCDKQPHCEGCCEEAQHTDECNDAKREEEEKAA